MLKEKYRIRLRTQHPTFFFKGLKYCTDTMDCHLLKDGLSGRKLLKKKILHHTIHHISALSSTEGSRDASLRPSVDKTHRGNRATSALT